MQLQVTEFSVNLRAVLISSAKYEGNASREGGEFPSENWKKETEEEGKIKLWSSIVR